MNVLLLTSRFPFPPERGDRLRTHGFLRSLAQDHHVELLSFVEHPPTEAALSAFPGVSVETILLGSGRSRWNLVRGIASSRPFQVSYYDSQAMRARVAARARDKDVVIAHLIRMAPYLNAVPPSTVRIVDLCDCIASEYRDSLAHRRGLSRFFYAEEAKRVGRFERETLERADESWVISSAEVSKFDANPRNVQVIPNGVAIPDFEDTVPPEFPTLLFTGNLSVPHNIDAATFLVREIFPSVCAEVPDARIRIAGADATDAVHSLAGPAVDVVGRVDDLFSFLRAGSVFVAPMRFVAGVQNKVLEAMAATVPVVMTAATARGIGAESGRHALVADDAAALAGGIVELLRNPVRARAIGRAGRALVQDRFSWNGVRERMRAIERARPGSSRT